MVIVDIFQDNSKGFFGLFKSKEVKVVVTLKDDPSQTAVKFLEEIFEKMNIETEIETRFDNRNLFVELKGSEMALLIGRRGQTLDSLQYLVSLVVNRENPDYIRIILDTENYQLQLWPQVYWHLFCYYLLLILLALAHSLCQLQQWYAEVLI